jgi:sulfatase maturation enzyme AslB (radical SAM superfamily)
MASNRISRVGAAFDGAAVVTSNASKLDENARGKTRMNALRQSECQDCPVRVKCNESADCFFYRPDLPTF